MKFWIALNFWKMERPAKELMVVEVDAAAALGVTFGWAAGAGGFIVKSVDRTKAAAALPDEVTTAITAGESVGTALSSFRSRLCAPGTI